MEPEPLKDKKKNRFPSYPNVTFYDEECISAAVEWLKETVDEYFERDDMPNRNNDIQLFIKKAFEDVIKKS